MKNSKTYKNTPESPIKHPLKMLKDMFADLRMSSFLAWRLIVRDLSAQYRQTMFGYLWAIFPPLVTTLLFIFLNKSQIIRVPEAGMPYPVYVITGTVFWQLFIDSINAPLNQVHGNTAMLTKINFPKEALIISGVIQVLFSFAIKLILLILVIFYFEVPIKLTVFFIIIPILGLLGIGTLFGTLLVPLGVLYKDIQQGLNIIMGPLMFLAPVVYPIPAQELLSAIMKYNPITPLILAAREFILNGCAVSWSSLIIVIIFTSVFLFIGWILYRMVLPLLVERMEA
jgi:lipopolysaccharide transport system permease protein